MQSPHRAKLLSKEGQDFLSHPLYDALVEYVALEVQDELARASNPAQLRIMQGKTKVVNRLRVLPRQLRELAKEKEEKSEKVKAEFAEAGSSNKGGY